MADESRCEIWKLISYFANEREVNGFTKAIEKRCAGSMMYVELRTSYSTIEQHWGALLDTADMVGPVRLALRRNLTNHFFFLFLECGAIALYDVQSERLRNCNIIFTIFSELGMLLRANERHVPQ